MNKKRRNDDNSVNVTIESLLMFYENNMNEQYTKDEENYWYY